MRIIDLKLVKDVNNRIILCNLWDNHLCLIKCIINLTHKLYRKVNYKLFENKLILKIIFDIPCKNNWKVITEFPILLLFPKITTVNYNKISIFSYKRIRLNKYY